jgi:hypothetical protein
VFEFICLFAFQTNPSSLNPLPFPSCFCFEPKPRKSPGAPSALPRSRSASLCRSTLFAPGPARLRRSRTQPSVAVSPARPLLPPPPAATDRRDPSVIPNPEPSPPWTLLHRPNPCRAHPPRLGTHAKGYPHPFISSHRRPWLLLTRNPSRPSFPHATPLKP